MKEERTITIYVLPILLTLLLCAAGAAGYYMYRHGMLTRPAPKHYSMDGPNNLPKPEQAKGGSKDSTATIADSLKLANALPTDGGTASFSSSPYFQGQTQGESAPEVRMPDQPEHPEDRDTVAAGDTLSHDSVQVPLPQTDSVRVDTVQGQLAQPETVEQ